MATALHSPATIGWEAFFRRVRGELNAFATKHWPLPADRSGPERILAQRRLFDLFPVPVDVAMLDTDGVDLRFKAERFATAIRYDLSQPRTLDVRDHGIVPLKDFEPYASMLQSAFGVDEETLTGFRELGFNWITGYPHILHIVRYDARGRISEYGQDLAELLVHSQLAELFELSHDFNSKHGLKRDPLWTESELLQLDDLSASFFRGDRADIIREVQERVARAKLIRTVPDEVARVIHVANRLYIFGLFDYEFFTVSQHYAYLAVEAALYHRWSATQSKPFVLTHGIDQLTIHDSGRGTIYRICEHKKWNRRNLRVNGQPFPFTTGSLLAKLRNARIITEWQYQDFGYWLKQRNAHSHREFGPLEMPDASVIHGAVEIVNALFD